jgi:hypothetical protein
MSATASTPTDVEAKKAPTPDRLCFVDFSAGRISSANRDGSSAGTSLRSGGRTAMTRISSPTDRRPGFLESGPAFDVVAHR